MSVAPEEEEHDKLAMGKFSIPYKHLQDLADACKGRKFADQVEMYEQFGGDHWLEQGLCTNLKKGLSGDDQDMQERKDVYGDNHEHVRPPKGFLELFLQALDDYTLRILLIASVKAVIINMVFSPPEQRNIAWIDGFSIFVAVMVCASVTSVNDYQKEKQFQDLNQVAGDRKQVGIIRNGELHIIHQSHVMVGDLIQLDEGMEVPADGIVIQAAELTTDQAAMTGEPDPIKKNTLAKCLVKQKFIQDQGQRNQAQSHDVPSCVIMSGTRILTGEGKMIVITTGAQSVIGKIKAILKQEDDEPTPLQHKLEQLAQDIGNFGLASAIIIVTVLLIRFTIERATEDAWNHNLHWSELIRFAIIGITVVVVAIPEGLPLAVTLSLAYSVQKMLQQQNLVRKMQACQTMGGADCICSDKTGTLTTNKMTLTHWWNQSLDQIPHYNEKIDLKALVPQNYYQLFVVSLACNGAAILRPEPKGSRTEIALLQFLDQCSVSYEEYREKYGVEQSKVKFPFSSARKRMGMVLPFKGKDVLFEKGGSDKIVAACSHFYQKSTGQVIPIDAALRTQIDEAIKTMADKALRTIGLAYLEVNVEKDDFTTKDEKTGVFQIQTANLVLAGILGIADVLRQQVPKAIVTCKKAGIQVRMVTGDNQDTARAIARDCGIVENSQDIVLEGDQFIQMTGGIICRNCKKNLDCKCPLDSKALEQKQKQVEQATATVKKWSEIQLAEAKKFAEIIRNGNNPEAALTSNGMAPTTSLPPIKGAKLTPENQKKGETFILSQKKKQDVKMRDDTLKDMEKFKSFYKKLAVMARSQPEHKYALVTGLKDLGHVVAVTGDGTNDAPALKQADVGFAMGIAGTEVAREAAAIILLDDNFASIVVACMWGRNIYDSIQQFLQFQLTVNVVAVFITLIGAATLKQDILRPIQMLWVNLIMDTFASLALATQPPTLSLLDRKPQSRDEYIMTKQMAKHVLGQALWQLIVLMLFLYGGPSFLPEYADDFDDFLRREQDNNPKKFPKEEWWMGQYSDEARTHVRPGNFRQVDGLTDQYEKLFLEYTVPPRHFTYIFAVFVWLQIFNFLNSRQLKDEINIFEHITSNMLFPVIVVLIIIMQIILTTFGGIAFFCYTYYGLHPIQWLICVGFASITLIVSVILKFIPQEQCIRFDFGHHEEAEIKQERSLSLRIKRSSSKEMPPQIN